MSDKIPLIPISQPHINTATNAVDALRDDDYEKLRSPAKTAIDTILGELATCKDVASMARTEHEKLGFINKNFVRLEYGTAAKFKALDMVTAYTDSIYKQLKLARQTFLEF